MFKFVSRVATTHYSSTTDVPSTQETVPVQIQTVQPAIQQPLQTVQQQTIQPTTADSAESIATTTEQPQTTFFTVRHFTRSKDKFLQRHNLT